MAHPSHLGHYSELSQKERNCLYGAGGMAAAVKGTHELDLVYL